MPYVCRTCGYPALKSARATRYTDKTFARAGFSLASGNNTFTAIAHDALGRRDTNAVTVNLPATVTFHYDPKGNLTNDGRRIFTYDDENHLVSVVVTNGVNDSVRSQFEYDGLFRRRVRNEYRWQGGAFVQTEEVRYVYDGRLPIQERNAHNLPLVTYTRGDDLSGSREEAGGIGGLLARSDMTHITPAYAYYHADGNGNVTALVNSQQRIAARYIYDPYGNVLAMSGPLADANLYRFSSKEAHPITGLVYYLYRYYDPNLQRWVNQDPIGEAGGISLYRYGANSPLGRLDPFGLEDLDDWLELPKLGGATRAGCLIDDNFTNPYTGEQRTGAQLAVDVGMVPVQEAVCNAAGLGVVKAIGALSAKVGSAIGGKLSALWCKCRPAAKRVSIVGGVAGSKGTSYFGGFDPETGKLHLGSEGHFGGMKAAGGTPVPGTTPGISVMETPTGVTWANDSVSLPRALTSQEAAQVQQALQIQFPGKPVVQVPIVK